MATSRALTEHDVAFAEVQRKADRETAIIRAFSITFWIAALALPILALQELVDPLAGRTTKVDVNVVISLALAVSLALNGFQYAKGRSQRSELLRQRERFTNLEAGQP